MKQPDGGTLPEPAPNSPPVITLKGRQVSAALESPGAAVVPSPGLPPASPPLAKPQHRLARHRWPIAGGVALLIAAIALVVFATGDSDGAGKRKATELLRASSQEFTRVLSVAGQVSSLEGLQAAGATARASTALVSQYKAQSVDVQPAELRVALTQIMDAQARVVQGLARLSEMARSEKRLTAWETEIRAQIQGAQSQLGASAIAAQVLDLPPDISPATQAADVIRVVSSVDAVVKRITD